MTQNRSALTGNFLMIITAALWGFAFVAQKTGMDHLSPYMFSAIRFVLGATCLVFLLRWFGGARLDRRGYIMGIAMGVVLTFGALMQQVGIVETTAGKGGFLTAIYILLVPIFLSFSGHKLALQIWPAAILAIAGLYLLSIKGGEFNSINVGDYWVLASAIFWAVHIILIEKAVKYYDPLRLSIVQFYTCGVLSLFAVFLFDETVWSEVLVGVKGGWLELLYGGVASVAVAYTLQVFAQRSVPSHHAALILSLEAVFAVIGGVWLLDEELTMRMVMGFGLIFSGIILAQIPLSGTKAKLKIRENIAD
ncbi:DMT family transporter [Cocleimonas flava]|uniref:Threonine/homoserine efflux transporter RhtA n=1 Tax=Cocleimonas flava TaxID=634765 RepID=A0A4R1ENN2_9GAMM|nr:DMT family transporter [Cocleimonas flava]TCJ82866.1 threonine/homoserine efflux transporter RhtA [Cocleimonas flava]